MLSIDGHRLLSRLDIVQVNLTLCSLLHQFAYSQLTSPEFIYLRPTVNDIQTIQNKISDTSGEIVMYQPDETIRLEVRLGEDTVWLSVEQMSLLFSREESNVRRHIINVFKEGELERENNVRFLHVNGVKKPVPFYNLDAMTGDEVKI